MIDNGKYIYINDGSEVVFRPGMKYNQINHQRMQLMNYRCYLNKNDPRKFISLVRPIFLNKNYWIIKDGKDLAVNIKNGLHGTAEKKPVPENEMESKMRPSKSTFNFKESGIQKWVEDGLFHAQYESLKLKKQDLQAEFDKKKNIDFDQKLLDVLKDINSEIKNMERIYGKKIKEIKKLQKKEEKEIQKSLNN